MDILKTEIERKRKQMKNANLVGPNKKFFKRGDLAAKQQEEYWKKYYSKHGDRIGMEPEQTEVNSEGALKVLENSRETLLELPRDEVIRRLRARTEPIYLFGESEEDALRRLRKIEIEQPDMKEGWKNDFQAALQEVDQELLKEVIEGTRNTQGKHDVAIEDESKDFDEITQMAPLLGTEDQPGRDCDIIYSFINYLLTRWGHQLNSRSEESKRNAHGKFDSGMHKQTVENLKPLMTMLKTHKINSDIRHHLVNVCRLLIIERNYILANNAYMEMAIGNAPWPVGVTRSGLHQRPGSAKSYVANIAHVLNDETQRKYIQGLKRLMTRCQEYFPSDPSKSVEYVRKQSSE